MGHGGRVYEAARKLGIPVEQILDASANIHPFGPPGKVIQAIQQAIPHIRHYPDATHHALKEAISHANGVHSASIICGNGATEVIELLFRHITPNRTIILEPAFSEYALVGQRVGSNIVRVPLDHTEIDMTWTIPFSRIDALVDAGDAIIINTPHNPTGIHWPVETWLPRAVEWAEQGVSVIVDLSFADFLNTDFSTLWKIAERTPNLFFVRSATKIYAIPGLRLGYGFAHPRTVEQIEMNRDGWSVNVLAQHAVIAALADDTFLDMTRNWLASEHQYIADTWGVHPGLRCTSSSANYFFVHFEEKSSAEAVISHCYANGILVRRCDDYHELDERDVRIAIRSRAENERVYQLAQEALRRVV